MSVKMVGACDFITSRAAEAVVTRVAKMIITELDSRVLNPIIYSTYGVNLNRRMLAFISVDFEAIYQLLIRHSAFVI
jgi:hypothetical protein